MIVGDFNIWINVPSNSEAARFMSLIEAFGLVQHVSGSTHVKKHTLDLFNTKASDNLVAGLVSKSRTPSPSIPSAEEYQNQALEVYGLERVWL